MNDAVSAGAWPERENPYLTRINEVCEYVKQVRGKTYEGIIYRFLQKVLEENWSYGSPKNTLPLDNIYFDEP